MKNFFLDLDFTELRKEIPDAGNFNIFTFLNKFSNLFLFHSNIYLVVNPNHSVKISKLELINTISWMENELTDIFT